jgi:hypothetical protein
MGHSSAKNMGMAKRQRINLTTKLAAALLALRDENGTPLIDYERSKKMAAAEIVAFFQFDHYPISHAIKPIDEAWNLRPMLLRPHREKSRKDAGVIAKVKRLKAAADLHAARRIASPIVANELAKLEKKHKWPRQRIANRPWPKIQRSFPKRHKA